MNSPKKILVDLAAEKEAIVTFADGDVILMKNFDPVDESIYDKDDLICAVLVRVISSSNPNMNRNLGSLLQFSELDVQKIYDGDVDDVLFEKS